MKKLLLIIIFFSTYSFAADSQIQVVENLDTCFSPIESCDQKLISVINTAKKTLDIAIFSITHPEIAESIVKAKQRGVKVRMVVDKGQSSGTRSQTDELVSSQVSIKIGNSGKIMHDKYCIIDNKILETGSFNYTMNATLFNTENQIYITDKKVIKKYKVNFERLWDEAFVETKASLDD